MPAMSHPFLSNETLLRSLCREVHECLTQNILPLWLNNMLDTRRGEWYWSIHEDGRVNLDDDHAGFWKCPYHNGRMCLELIERIGTMLRCI